MKRKLGDAAHTHQQTIISTADRPVERPLDRRDITNPISVPYYMRFHPPAIRTLLPNQNTCHHKHSHDKGVDYATSTVYGGTIKNVLGIFQC